MAFKKRGGFKKKRFKKRKGGKVGRKVGKLNALVKKPGTVFKISKTMERKSLVMPERVQGCFKWKVPLNITNPAIAGRRNFSFLLLPQQYGVTGLNVQNNLAGNHVNDLNYELTTGLFAGNYIVLGGGAITNNTHGHTDLAEFYGQFLPYASKLKIVAQSSTNSENLFVMITPIPRWYTGLTLYNTDDYLSNSLARQYEGNYTRMKNFSEYEQGRKPLTSFIRHNEFCGLSKEVYMNDSNRLFDYQTIQPGNPGANNQSIVMPCWQVTVVSTDAINFTGNISLFMEMDVYGYYCNEYGATETN